MTRYLVDTNVFLYARGLDHPYRQPCRTVLAAAGDGQVRLEASTEVMQEFVHVLLRRGASGGDAADETADVRRQCRVHPFDDEVLTLALGMIRQYPHLGARDAVHAATAVVVGIAQILSADQVFDSLAEVDRIDPLHAAALFPVAPPAV